MADMAGTLQGPPGIPGGVMAWKGAYNAGTTYAINDAVYYGGSGYYSLVNGNVGHTPPAGTSNSYWSIFALAGGLDISGWIPAPALTFGAADAPTYTATCSGDYSAIIMPGMRMKMTQGGSVKYFIVTKVAYSSPNTTITLYGGTDYTLGSTITLPYYSMMKAPAGFPMDRTKWRVVITDATAATQATPTLNQWYNLNAIQIAVPIGAWRILYKVQLEATRAVSNPMWVMVTLSTANNSESNTAFTQSVYNPYTTIVFLGVNMIESLQMASKTVYYLNAKDASGSVTALYFNGATPAPPTLLIAECAYL